ncbi:MAG: hypothetical protein R3344_08260 [Acidobacteriota bacterium]|nr:hypothetical protein [Acidobacteriota bacterium]
MSKEKPLKSSYELAMERLRAKDREEGVEHEELTGKQKKEIARLRQEAKAKLAEIEILHKDALAEAGGDHETIRKIEEAYAIDRERVESKTETKVAAVKKRG